MGDITKNPERWVVILAWSLGLAILAIIGLVVALGGVLVRFIGSCYWLFSNQV